MNIMYTCDNNYVWIMGISVISLFENNKNCSDLNVFLLGENISKENKDILNRIAEEYCRKIFVIDVPKLDIPDTLVSARWPLSAFTRLFSGILLPKEIDKILYLDCDTIICGDITELDGIDFKGKMVCGVLDCISGTYKKNIGLTLDNPYINAGVLLFDVNELRKLDIKNTIDSYMKKYMKLINYADQDILNGMFKGEIGILNPKFDVMTIDVVHSYKEIKTLRKPTAFYSEEELLKGIRDRRIIHYTTNMRVVRPWFTNTDHPLASEFRKYMEMSPWKDKVLADMIFSSKEAKIIGVIEKLPKKLAYSLLGLIHTKMKPWVIKIKAR